MASVNKHREQAFPDTRPFQNSSIPNLERKLRRELKGEVRFDNGSRALYATDSSNYRQVPIGVVVPKDADDVIAAVSIAREFQAPILPRGGGTSLAGQCCNVAVVIDMSKYMNRIIELDPGQKIARVQPGIVLDDVRNAAEKFKLTFAPDPATHNHCTLGGMIGNNSCGVHSVMAGKTDDNIEELDILTYTGLRMRVGRTGDDHLDRIIRDGGSRGEIYSRLVALRDRLGDSIRKKFPNIPRRVSGYNLPYLLPENSFHVARALVGSEGTCVTVLEATLRLVDSPPGRTLLVIGFPDIYVAADAVPEIVSYGPIGLEGIDDILIDGMKRKGLHVEKIAQLPPGKGWLLAEFGGIDQAESRAKAEIMEKAFKPKAGVTMHLCQSRHEAETFWKIRESGLGASSFIPGEKEAWEGWEDSAVAPEKLGAYLRELRKLCDAYKYRAPLYGHFGQGCVHNRINFDLFTAEGIAKFRSFMTEAADLVVSYGGSLSGEHGDGQSRGELLPKMYGPELMKAFEEFKSIWDPEWKMNPGKVVLAYPMDSNLRFGERFVPKPIATHFQYPKDEGSFSRATMRCVGVGECRRTDHGTMCPSYRATRDEEHSTRGRARLLFEMMQGDTLHDGWHDESVKKSLDLCLACKGCRTECPVNVDMATYKAEFLSHYYENRLRPQSAYAMGLVYWWARAGSLAPWAANALTQTPGLREIVKLIGGISPHRSIPKFAPKTFRAWFNARSPQQSANPSVILWPDTFNNHFHPETAKAAVNVLERAGYTVAIPPRPLCCGRPLYDYGFLHLAKKLLRQTLTTLHPQIVNGTPIVGLEPSCVAVFRDELPNLFPNDETAKRLSTQVFTLAEFLSNSGAVAKMPKAAGDVTYHGHCQHKAVMGTTADAEILRTLGMSVNALDSGCCGMAGSFGFEREHYEISQKIGELSVLPTVRSMPESSVFVADGFSCREQVFQATGKLPLHLAELLDRNNAT
ncbi:MAG TPA: FAD-linked oxidase C-terminal domain-containing protein [Bacteroidota bacterium]|nr:FAD-linked oxidase C-terminal domain-containing protein [Bacteroidota bacterium]